MLNIKYNYPHTFFLSVGIVLLIFGFYPFYIANLNITLIHLSKIIIHGVLLAISVLCILIGFKLWGEKEKEKKEMAEITKKRINQSIEIKELSLQEKKAKNQLGILKQEVKILETRKREKKEIEGEIKIKKSEIEKFNKEILVKQKEIGEKTSKLYELQKEEISKTPDNYLLTSTWTTSTSGSNIVPDFSMSSITPYADSNQKRCSKCGNFYTPISWIPDEGLCQTCKRFF